MLNRRVGRLELFEKPSDYSAFEKILAEAYQRTGIRIACYCLMPNQWHLLLWPRSDGELSEVMRGIRLRTRSAGTRTDTLQGGVLCIRGGSSRFPFRPTTIL